MANGYYDFSSAFSNLNQSLAGLGKQFDEGRKRRSFAELGKKVQAGDHDGAAQQAFAAGDVGTALTIMKYGQDARKLAAGETAARELGQAIGGLGLPGLGAPAQAAPQSPETGSALPASLNVSESGGNWQAQNDAVGAGGQRGHFGRGQFGQARLREAAAAGAIPQGTTPQAFMASPELQKQAENWHFGSIDKAIQANGFDRLVGQQINGVPITVEGLRAVAHLGGEQGMKRFVETGGAYNPSDANGTSLMDYFRQHGGGTRLADAVAPGAANASVQTGQEGYFIPPGEQPQGMSAQTFNAVASGNRPLDPVFQSEGISQPWMGSALSRLGQGAIARLEQPGRRYGRNADLQPQGGAPTVAQMPQQRLPAPVEIDPNSPDGGARAFAASQNRNAPVADASGFVVPPADTSAGSARGAAPVALPISTQPAQYTGSGTSAVGEFTGERGRTLAGKMFSGDEVTAMQRYASALRMFAARAKANPDNPEAQSAVKLLMDISDKRMSPEDLSSAIFGFGNKSSTMNLRLVDAIGDLIGKEGPEWAAIRQGVWQRIANVPEGMTEMGAQKMSQRILQFVGGEGQSLATRLFSSQEIGQMRKLAAALKQTVPPAGTTNHSNSGNRGAEQMREVAKRTVEALLTTLGATMGGWQGAMLGLAGGKGIGTVAGMNAARQARGLYYGGAPTPIAPRLAERLSVAGKVAPRSLGISIPGEVSVRGSTPGYLPAAADNDQR